MQAPWTTEDKRSKVKILWKKHQSKYATDTEKYMSLKPSRWFDVHMYIP